MVPGEDPSSECPAPLRQRTTVLDICRAGPASTAAGSPHEAGLRDVTERAGSATSLSRVSYKNPELSQWPRGPRGVTARGPGRTGGRVQGDTRHLLGALCPHSAFGDLGRCSPSWRLPQLGAGPRVQEGGLDRAAAGEARSGEGGRAGGPGPTRTSSGARRSGGPRTTY